MSWCRYDDELGMNRKVCALLARGVYGVAAWGLHPLLNAWSRYNGTAGHIPAHQPGLSVGDQRLGRRLAAMLEEVGMLDPTDDGWVIHDFDDYSDPNDDGRSAAEKKKEISAKRSVAGRSGGLAKAKQTAGKSLPLPQQTSGPEPDPVPSVQVRGNFTPEHTPEPVDNTRRDDVLDAYEDLAIEVAEGKGAEITSYTGYRKRARETGTAHRDLDRWLDLFPTAPATAIAAWMTGDTHSMRNYPRADEIEERLATVHHLPGQEHAS